MSAENVELVRRSLEGLSAAGFDEDSPAMMHPEGRLYPPEQWPGPALYEGLEGRAALLHEWTATFDFLSLEIDRLIDDGDRVIALMRIHGTSKTTGVDVEWPLGLIASHFDEGRAREVRWFISTEATLAAAGMETPS